jgi:hypothetical protein
MHFAFEIDDHTFVFLDNQTFGVLDKSKAPRFGLPVRSGKVGELSETVYVTVDPNLFPALPKLAFPKNRLLLLL